LAPTSLLEIGSGQGFFLEKVQTLNTKIEGVDINPDAIAACKRKGLKVGLRNIFEITESFDAVVSFQVLEHMDNLKALMELYVNKLVRPGGHLIIAVPNPDGYLKELGVNLLDMPPHHNSGWGLPTFKFLAEQYGLTMVEYVQEPIRYVHYLSLIQSVYQDHAQLTTQSWRSRLFRKIQGMVVRLFSPFAYLHDREKIGGQTHLVVFKNGQ
jgi:2-polyprenyl-3-methyl-5-hydroxy-6-metoxy-1,4-benzoquinol methylase